MLLTIKQPGHQGYRSFHEYSPPTPPSTSRFSPNITSSKLAQPVTAVGHSFPPLQNSQSSVQPMSTPHRGLPPPAAMTLPQPSHQSASIGQSTLNQASLNQPMGPLPAPPQQWQGAEESMKNWLHAKAEEDKRKQEEEKTRQEALRLEQRKIEQGMLRDSLSGGIPPYMIPMVFAGMGGGNLPNASLEWAQHYMAQSHQLQHQHQQHPQLLASQHTSPEQAQRQEGRPHAHSIGSQSHPAPTTLPSTPIGPPGQQQSGGFLPSYQLSPASRSRQNAQVQATIVRPPPTTHLPRLNTGEMHIQPPPPGPSMQIVPGQPGHPLQHSQLAQQQETQASPSIYFHHWQPPTSQAGTSSGNQPTTPSGKHPTSSPKKRKATGPPPTSQPPYTSPPFSQTGPSVSNTPSGRRRGHSRQRSDLSSRGYEPYGRPGSRHQHGESSFGTHSMSSPRQFEQAQAQTASTQPRRRSGGANPVSSILEQSDSRPQSQFHQQSQSHQQHDPHYAAAPEMGEKHTTPEDENLRRPKALKRDDVRD
ncbi:hypothetical protein GLAREA_00460 [Glarea lozoyensis ATCC 20868]|uniref:Uncharacterized protein n=1 Tax=Glarea lozoyensis (strain ATCC 20868 / MF5171) TaxID=1116229 RepID=S3CUL2_GLAL2|nr:uncharacterized protein GLAREA_00460 [Glarea lozoyensis ATCC 20868]EPE29300.1 hypothetical protein GLAREA_00460 [Glarea lozoyensis ATCC 20868]